MRARFRTLIRPETLDHLPPPAPSSALALWCLGTSWALVLLWLWWRGWGSWVWVPAAVALLMFATWRLPAWSFVLPILAPAAAARELVSPTAPAHPGLLDVVVCGVGLLAIARHLARRGRRRVPGRPAARGGIILPWPLALAAPSIVLLDPAGARTGWMRVGLIALLWAFACAVLVRRGVKARSRPAARGAGAAAAKAVAPPQERPA